MQLYRFTHDGKVCSGDYLVDSENEGVVDRAEQNADYLIVQGQFILVMIIMHYSMFGLVLLTIIFVAATLKYKKQGANENASSVAPSSLEQ